MRQMLVAGNWKMNTLRKSARQWAEAIAAGLADFGSVEVMVAPPFPYLLTVGEAIRGRGIELGAQNAWFEEPGAFTGEVAFGMLADIGCRYIILGHSERRHILGESDELINKKVAAALKKGLLPVLCVGELLDERDAGQTESVLDRQMKGTLAGLDAGDLKGLVVAYEPVWAIGTGRTATPEQAESAHMYLRKWLADRYNSEVGERTRILYGGSVKPDNADSLMARPDVDGALVGGASLKADSFLAIVQAAARA